jgi:proline iminopeptidase
VIKIGSVKPVTNSRTAGRYDIVVDGVRQVYHVAGSGPVAVLHSGGPGIDWRYLRLQALEEHLTTVYVEPVGTGESGRLATHPEGYTIERYVRHLHAVIEALGTPVLLIGHSHGGFVAQRYALDHPGGLSGLVLWDTTPYCGPEWQADIGRNLDAMVERLSHRPQMPAVRDAVFAEPESTDEAFTQMLKQALPAYFSDFWTREQEWAPFREAVRGYVVSSGDWNGTFDVRAELKAIGARTLVLVGRHDFICSPRWAGELYRGIPGAELVEFAHSGHFPHLEEPEAFIGALVRFATGHAAEYAPAARR